MIEVDIDSQSGFCFGVQKAIETAEKQLHENGVLYALGDLVHNNAEMDRLKTLGLTVIDKQEFNQLTHTPVLFRAHGEPPSSYQQVQHNQNQLIDATCPIVLKLQERIRKAWQEQNTKNGQVVLFGKKAHAETIGLHGQTNFECIVVENLEEANQLDFQRPIELFSQTTQNPAAFQKLADCLKSKSTNPETVIIHNTTCRQVTGRADRLATFAKSHDIVLLVGGAKSSNSKVLYEISLKHNPRSYFITSETELNMDWFRQENLKIGIFGATSTPRWLMENIAKTIVQNHKINQI